jgi:hypothetical protein
MPTKLAKAINIAFRLIVLKKIPIEEAISVRRHAKNSKENKTDIVIAF